MKNLCFVCLELTEGINDFLPHIVNIHISFELRNFKIRGLFSAEQLMFQLFFWLVNSMLVNTQSQFMTQSPAESTQPASEMFRTDSAAQKCLSKALI